MSPMDIKQELPGVKEVVLLSSGSSMNGLDSMLSNVRQKHWGKDEEGFLTRGMKSYFKCLPEKK